MYGASKKVWQLIATHVEKNRADSRGNPQLAGHISPLNATRILEAWHVSE